MRALTEPYPLDNSSTHSATHHQGLAAMLDGWSLRRITDLVRLDRAAVLEIGAGDGSMAYQLASMVGEKGSVTALDLKPGRVTHPQLRWVQHDLRIPEAIPGGTYDVIHGRLVLSHLPEREHVLDRLIQVSAAGTLIVVEDWQPMRSHPVVSAPTVEARRLYEKYVLTAGKCFDQRGTDPTWAARMHCVFKQHGLVNVDTDFYGTFWEGGSPEANHAVGVTHQIRDELVLRGMTEHEVDEVLDLLANPELTVHSHILYSTSGYVSAD